MILIIHLQRGMIKKNLFGLDKMYIGKKSHKIQNKDFKN